MLFSCSTVLALLALVTQLRAQGIVCMDYGGAQYPNNTQCTGSLACCGSAAGCTANRMCLADNGQLIRPTCSVYPWTDECSPLCLYQGTSGFLPRLSTCSDGSFCCDNDPQCCAQHEGVVINDSGEVVSTDSPLSSTSTVASSAATSSVTSSTNPATTTTTSPTTSIPQSPASTSPISVSASSTALPVSTIVGAVFGSVFALIAIVAIFLLYRRRGKARYQIAQQSPPMPPETGEIDHYAMKKLPLSQEPQWQSPAEVEAGDSTAELGVPEQQRPVEMMG